VIKKIVIALAAFGFGCKATDTPALDGGAEASSPAEVQPTPSCKHRSWNFEDGLVGRVQVENFAQSTGPALVAEAPAGGSKALRIPVTAAGKMDEVLVHMSVCDDVSEAPLDLFGKRIRARFYLESADPASWGTRGFSMKPPVISSTLWQQNAWQDYDVVVGDDPGANRPSFVSSELMFDLGYSGTKPWTGVIWLDDVQILDQ
jgi:hypothetical protein